MKIGRKIAGVLGGTTMLMAAMSTLALWGNQANERQWVAMNKRQSAARLAERIGKDTAEFVQNLGKMVIEKSDNPDVRNRLVALRTDRSNALQEFKMMADGPASSQQAADIDELIKAAVGTSNTALDFVARGRFADAPAAYRAYSAVVGSLQAKVNEVAEYQARGVTASELALKRTSNTVWMSLLTGSLCAIVFGIFGGVILTRNIAKPLAAVDATLGQIAKGDLSTNAPPELQRREDEVGTLARSTQTMTVALRKMVEEISGGIQVLSSSSTTLTASSMEMTSGSRHASEKAHSVSAAAEEMSSNITTVSAAMEQTSINLTRVSSATEQMTSTIAGIAQDSEKARRMTEDAACQAAQITQQMNELGTAASAIGKVTETIVEISTQTNLLALNATIEAARAGSAGKGFAVVANEIKALAQQTGAATEDIKARISSVQSAAVTGIAEIGSVSQVIRDISTIVASIATAIEEQSIVTRDISRNIAEATIGVAEVNARVSETSQVSREIARDIVTVDQSAREMSNGSEHVGTSAGELSGVAAMLRLTVGRFHS